MKTFSTFETIKILGLKRPTLKTWMDKGFITPSFKTDEGKGPGSKSRFTTFQLYLIRLFQVLLHHDIARKTAAKLIEAFDKDQQQAATTEKIITIFKGRNMPTHAKTTDEPINLSEYRINTQRLKGIKFEHYYMVIVLNFEKIKTEVDWLIGR